MTRWTRPRWARSRGTRARAGLLVAVDLVLSFDIKTNGTNSALLTGALDAGIKVKIKHNLELAALGLAALVRANLGALNSARLGSDIQFHGEINCAM